MGLTEGELGFLASCVRQRASRLRRHGGGELAPQITQISQIIALSSRLYKFWDVAALTGGTRGLTFVWLSSRLTSFGKSLRARKPGSRLCGDCVSELRLEPK